MTPQQDNVIGPIGPGLWRTMRQIRGSLGHYQKNYHPKYDEAIEKETFLYKDYMEKALTKRAVKE